MIADLFYFVLGLMFFSMYFLHYQQSDIQLHAVKLSDVG